MRRCREAVVGDGMTVGCPAPVGKSLIFFVGPVRTGFREFLTAKMASGFLGIDGMSMENAMSKKLNRRGGRFVLLAAALLFAWGLRADTATVDGYTYTYSVTDGKVTIGTGETVKTAVSPKPTGRLTVPSELGGYPVTGLGESAFYNCTGVTDVTIPNGVTHIGPRAFASCASLENVTIGSGVTQIDFEVFPSCRHLRNIAVDPANTAYMSQNGMLLTKDGKTLVYGTCGNSVIPSGVTTIGRSAFFGRKLESVQFPSSVTNIGGWAFAWCRDLKLTIPDTVTQIDGDAFQSCFNLNVWLPRRFEGNLSPVVFRDCSNLTVNYYDQVPVVAFRTEEGVVEQRECLSGTKVGSLPPAPTLAGYAFEGWWTAANGEQATAETVVTNDVTYYAKWRGTATVDSYTYTYSVLNGQAEIGASNAWTRAISPSPTGHVTVPSSLGGFPVVGIGDYAFYGFHYKLKSVTIPSGVVRIGEWAFSGCPNLTDVTIPDSVEKIGEWVFQGCHGLTKILVDPANTFYMSQDGMLLTKDGRTLVLGVNGVVTIPSGVTVIGESAFANLDGLTQVTIPAGVTTIGQYAFHGCDGLADVVIPGSVTNIGEGALSMCGRLTAISVVAENEVYSSRNGMLLNKDGTVLIQGVNGEVEIPSSVRMIGKAAFLGCSGLTRLVIPNNVTNIALEAFGNYRGLTDVVFPDDIQFVGAYAFGYLGGRLANVTLPAYLVERSDPWSPYVREVFYGTSVENVTMAEGITTIGSYAFAQAFTDETCPTHVTLPNSVTVICENAFYHNPGLRSVTIPTGVEQIDQYAFSSCDGLTEITIPNSVTNIGADAFNCRGLVNVTVPACVLKAGLRTVFPACSSITNVVLSEGCREIARGTLGYSGQFPKLEHVLIPASVTNIEAEAFRTFRGKVAVTVDPANAVYSSRDGMLLTKDGTRLLQGVNGDVAIPPGVTSIDARAFDNCNGLTRVVIPNSVTNIGNFAFKACSNLDDVWMPKHLEGKLSANVFTNCGNATLNYYDALYGVTFQTEEGVVEQRPCPAGTSIGTLPFTPTHEGYAFEGWWTATDGEQATEATVVTNDVTYYAKWRGTAIVGDYTYMYSVLNGQAEIGASNAWTMAATAVSPEPTGVVVIPSILGKYPVTSIGEKAFSYCYDVTSFEIPEGVVDVRSHSFTLCSRLTDVIVPSSVTGIDMSAFQFCDKLVNFTVNPANAVYSSRNGLLLSKDGRTLMRGVNGEVVIPSCVTEIGDSAFKGFRGLKSVVIPDGVLSIGANAFNSCRTLMDMAIPQSVTNIGTRAFDGSCIGHFLVDAANGFYTSREGMLLTKDTETLIRGNMGNDGEVVIPDGVKIVGEGAFKSLGLECATIPNSVTNIGVSAFEGCWDLAQVIIPGSVKTIEMRAFDSCENLVSLEIDRGLESIGVRAFGSCRLTRVTIPDSVTNIEWGAFSDCRELKEVWLPQHLEGRLVGVFPWCDAALVLNYYDALYTVVFRSEEGIEEGRRLCPSGESLGDLPQLPIRAGAVFAGWWTADGKRVSAKTVVTGDMTLEPRWRVVAAPVITPADGTTFRTYESCTVTITCADADAVIYYSTDGRMPHLTEACRYKGPFTIDRTTTIRAVAILDDVRSTYVAATLTQEIFMLQYRDGYHDDDAVWLTFTTGGDAPWGEEVPMGILNGDIYDFRLRSGPVGDEEESWLQTSVVGRGTFSFRWKVDCEYDDFGEAAWDHLAVFTNGVEAVRMDGTRGWERMSFTFDDDGRHTIRWVFVKDGYDEEDAAYEDCAWLGRFSWNPADVAVDTGKGRTVTVPGTWLGKRTMRAATDVAANGRRVWECYLLGLDPEEADDDFRIASFEVVDGVPAFTFSHTRDGSGVSFEPRIRILGKARLDDAAWTEMPEGGDPALRFFKAEVALP